MAKASDARIASGDGRPLEGFRSPSRIMFCTAGVRSTACSHILDNFVPTYESTVTSQLWRDGAVLLGKTNCDEFAMGSSNETSHFGSGAFAVAAQGLEHAAGAGRFIRRVRLRRSLRNSALGATGTDTGGSIRQPAALYRHRRREADLRPLLALGHRCLRIFARSGGTVRTHACAMRRSLLRSMAGPDPKDTTSVDLAVPDYEVGGRQIGERPAHRHPEGVPA